VGCAPVGRGGLDGTSVDCFLVMSPSMQRGRDQATGKGGSRDDRLFFPIKALSVNGYLVRTFPRPEDEVDRDRDVQGLTASKAATRLVLVWLRLARHLPVERGGSGA